MKMGRLIDLTGKKINKLTVIKRVENRNGKPYWLCECECGGRKEIAATTLRAGTTKTCGCLIEEIRATQMKDIAGKRFGRWTVVERIVNKKDYWLCKCECGAIKHVYGSSLRRGKSKSCGCTQPYYGDLTNKRFGRLVVLKELGLNAKGGRLWQCLCDCGNRTKTTTNGLVRDVTTSCGCFSRECSKERIKKFNKDNHVENTNLNSLRNKKTPKHNKSGVRGVALDNNKFTAQIGFQKRKYHLGTFNTLEEAAAARKEAEERLHDAFLEWYYETHPEKKQPFH